MFGKSHKPRSGGVSVFKVVPPQDGGWSLMPMENLLRGFRGDQEAVSLELYAIDGIISYRARTPHGDSMNGMFRAYFPGAELSSHLMGDVPGEAGESDVGDWMLLDEHERAMVLPLGLERESYLPLRVFDDRAIQQAQMDPLAGLIGLLSDVTMKGEYPGSDRFGVRLVLRPAPEGWNAPWQKFMQSRRDGDDRTPKTGGGPVSSVDSGLSTGAMIGVGGLGGIAALNWLMYQSGNIPGLILADAALASLGMLAFYLKRRYFSSPKGRVYMDELLVEEKLKSLGFWSELQIVRIYRDIADDTTVRKEVDLVVDCLRSFDDPAGNAWSPGRLMQYDGMKVVHREYGRDFRHPFVGGSQILDWIEPKRASNTILSAHEAASIWHPPLGMNEMASMERIASGALVPYLGELTAGNEDSGPLVGVSGTREIRLPESSIRKHAVILGRSGVGKSTLIKHIVDYKLRRKAVGKDPGAIVVIDPHADLVREILTLVPPEIAHKVRLLDFGRMDRVPGINLVDPMLFPDRDRCVDTIINTVKHLWEHWGGRLEDLLKNSLMIVYEFNSHPDTPRNEMLTMLDILALLDEGVQSGRGRDVKTEPSPFQRRTLSRVNDPRLKQWFQGYLNWPRDTRAEAVGPVHSRIGAYAKDQRASVIMGQRESTIMLTDVLQEGLVLLVSTAQGTIGKGPAALMGGTIVSLVESALRAQENLDPSQRARCLLVCDEFQTVTGADWEGLFAEIRKYGCSLMLATQSLARLDTGERKLKAGVLGNVGVIIGYQMSAEDARIISPEMDAERVPEKFLVNLNPHHCCVRINSDTTCYPAFSMKTLPPPDVSRGSHEAVDAVLAGSVAYTADWALARAKMNEELTRMLEGSDKMGGYPDPEPESGDGPVQAAPALGSSVYDSANSSAKKAPAPAPARVPKPAARSVQPADPAPSVSGNAFESDGAPEPAERERQPALTNSGPASPTANGASPEDGLLAMSGVRREHLDTSAVSPGLLSYLASPEGQTDPGVQAVLRSIERDSVSKGYRRGAREARKDVAAQVQEQAAEMAEGMTSAIHQRAMVDARRELCEVMFGGDSASEDGAAAPGARSLAGLRRRGSQS